jgi:hypothetical protein
VKELARQQLVRISDSDWLLSAEPPGELLKLTPVPSGLAGQVRRSAVIEGRRATALSNLSAVHVRVLTVPLAARFET